jgi:hypothetical protein
MNFLYPSFLFALGAIAIPVVIHLFNFRKFETVYFSNVSFLRDLKQETQSVSRLKHLLVLACRIMAIIFLVLAFAQPFIPSKNKASADNAIVSVFIDDSYSMESVNKNGTLLDEAKKRAHEIADFYPASTRLQLLTNDFEGRHQRLVNKADFMKLIDEVGISSSTKKLPEIIVRQEEALKQTNDVRNNKTAYIISDFQKSISTIKQLKNDSSLSVFFVPVTTTARNNVYIDTCWFESPVHRFGQIEKLHVLIKNVSDKKLENNPVKLYINEVQKTPASFSVDKSSETEIVFSFVIIEEPHLSSEQTNQLLQQCRIELNDYPISFDDTFYFSFEITQKLPVLCINNDDKLIKNNYLSQLFITDSIFSLTEMAENKLDYSTFLNYKLIILNELKTISSGLSQELKKFIDNGGSVLIFPNSQIDFTSYKEFLSSVNADYFKALDTTASKVNKINLESFIYKDVFDKKTYSANNLDLPLVKKHYIIYKNTKSSGDYLLKLQNGDNFLNQFSVGKGNLYLCAVPLNLDFSNFAKHALFVPTIYKIGLSSKNAAPLFYTIGNNEAIEYSGLKNNENSFHIKSIKNNFDFIPEQKIINSKTELLEHNQIKTAGNYHLISNKEVITGFSFNYNRNESDITCYNAEQLKEQLESNELNTIKLLDSGTKSLNQTLSETNQAKKLWKICLILALLFIAAEVLLLRFMKEQRIHNKT